MFRMSAHRREDTAAPARCALAIWEKVYGQNGGATANACNTLAAILDQLGKDAVDAPPRCQTQRRDEDDDRARQSAARRRPPAGWFVWRKSTRRVRSRSPASPTLAAVSAKLQPMKDRQSLPRNCGLPAAAGDRGRVMCGQEGPECRSKRHPFVPRATERNWRPREIPSCALRDARRFGGGYHRHRRAGSHQDTARGGERRRRRVSLGPPE